MLGVGVTIIKTYTCDTCERELEVREALFATLPIEPGDPTYLRLREAGLVKTNREGVYCSWECIRRAVDGLAAASQAS